MSQTTSIATTEVAEGSPAADAPGGGSVVRRDGIVGLFVRGLIVTAVMAVVVALMLLARNWQVALVDLTAPILAGVTFVLWLAMMVGLVCGEYPRGDQLAMARVGLATFCRTGFPLLVILVAVNYATRLNSVALYVGVLYAAGLVSSLALEVSRLGFANSRRQVG